MELHSSGYTETCCLFFQTFHFQFSMTFDRRHKNVSRSGFFSHHIWQEFPPPCFFFFTMLCCSLIWAYFNLLIKYARSSLCSQELNHVRLTQSPCKRIFFNIININSMCSSLFFVLSKPKCQYSGQIVLPFLLFFVFFKERMTFNLTKNKTLHISS